MRKQLWWERLGMLSLFLTLISVAIAVTINFTPLYSFDVDHYQLLDYTSLSKEELMANYRQLIQFLNNPWNHTLALPDFPMSESGAGHFYDVKKLFILNYVVLLLTILPSVYLVFRLKKNRRFWRFVRPMQWAMILPILFGLVMAMGFDNFFVKFHQVLFSNDDWLFNPATDPIINVLPEDFFMHCFILFFGLIEVFFFLFYWMGKRELKKA